VEIIYEPPLVSEYIFSSIGGKFDLDYQLVRWNFEIIPPKKADYLIAQVSIYWALPGDLPVENTGYIYSGIDPNFSYITSFSKDTNICLLCNILPSLASELCNFACTIRPEHVLAWFKGMAYCKERYALGNSIQCSEVGDYENEAQWDYICMYWSKVMNALITIEQGGDASVLIEELEEIKQKLPEPKECGPKNPSIDTDSWIGYIALPFDPNAKHGPEDYVLPSQKLNYTIEYENEGKGIAFGVYFTDILDEDLDDSTLEIGSVINTTDCSVITPAGIYDPGTRTITWFVGEVGPEEKGCANLSVNVRSDVKETEIINYATVYFPSVPEETRTNGIVSIVDITPPRYSNVNQSKSVVTAGEAVEVYAYWQDGVQLNYTWLETNDSTTLQNVSYLEHSGNEAWSNFTIQTTQKGMVCWRIHANDTAGNKNATPMLCFDVQTSLKSPVALFNYTPLTPVAGELIMFNASSSHDPEGYIANYKWDFGDGNVTSKIGPIIDHIYFSSGNYTVNLTVTDNDGLSDSTTKYINITPAQKTHTISLTAGWNLISVPLNLTTWELGEEAVVGNPLNVTPKNSLVSIYRYNATSTKFEKCDYFDNWGWGTSTGSEEFTKLEPGRGYWIMAKNDCVWGHEV